MIEHPRELKRIYIVSPIAFCVLSSVYGWLTPAGALLGLAVNTTDNGELSTKNEVEKALDTALDRVNDSIVSCVNRELLDELIQTEEEPDNLSSLIKQAISYQSKYCTSAGMKEIIDTFEVFLRDEISKSPSLSNLYVLSSGLVPMDKLKAVSDILFNYDSSEACPEGKLKEGNKAATKIGMFWTHCLNTVAFVVISMAVFIGLYLLSDFGYDKTMIWIAPICFLISEVLVVFLQKGQYIFMSIGKGIQENIYQSVPGRWWKLILTIFIPLILPVPCFWSLCLTMGIRGNIIYPTISLLLGSLASMLLKETRF